jgi:hypothetical protein
LQTKRPRLVLSILVALAGALGVYLASTAASSADRVLPLGAGTEHSPNMRLVANYSEGGEYRNGTDMAFWGNTALLGNLDQGVGPNASPAGGFRILDISNPRKPRKVGQFTCWGDQSDVSIWRDLVIVSVDKPTTLDCSAQSGSWEGIRVVSIADPENPEILASVATDCGSHTNTIYPDLQNDRLLVYVLSYPLAGRYNPAGALPTCNARSHRKFSVVEVPLSDPANPRLLSTPSVETNIGCHDVTLFLERKLAAAACLTESQMWDLSNPEQPRIVATIRDPRINIHHSSAFSNDGNTLILGDELGGAAASPGCVTDEDTYGGLFFYDVTDPSAPSPAGKFKLPQQQVSEFCTAHLFNVVPLPNQKDVLVSSWYTGATSVIDFTDPKRPEQIAYYVPRDPVAPNEQPTEAAAWSSYWYRGHIYSNNFDEDVNSISPQSRGLDVFEVKHPLLRGAMALPRLNPQVQEPLRPRGSRR